MLNRRAEEADKCEEGVFSRIDPELDEWAAQLLKENNIPAWGVTTGLLARSWDSGKAAETSQSKTREWHQDFGFIGQNVKIGDTYHKITTLEMMNMLVEWTHRDGRAASPVGSPGHLRVEKLILVYVTLENHSQGTSVCRVSRDDYSYTLSAVEGDGVAIDNARLFHSNPILKPEDAEKPVVRALFRILVYTKPEPSDLRYNDMVPKGYIPGKQNITRGTVEMPDIPVGDLSCVCGSKLCGCLKL